MLFLGTISLKATQQRNVSAIYFLGHSGAVLMDCGEGTYGQLWDHFGYLSTVNEVLLKTRVIFLSHMHGDHHMGVYRFLSEIDKLLPDNCQEKYFIVCPDTLTDYL